MLEVRNNNDEEAIISRGLIRIIRPMVALIKADDSTLEKLGVYQGYPFELSLDEV